MRRTNNPRSFDHRSTASSSNNTTSTTDERDRLRKFHFPRSTDHKSTASSAHTTTATNEDRERLRNFLNGAIAGPAAPPDHKQALLQRVLKRSQNMDKKVPEPKAPETKPPEIPLTSTSSVASTAQTKSNFEAEREVTSTRLTPQALEQVAAAPPAGPSLGRRLERVDANPTAMEFRNRLRKVTTQQQQQAPPQPESSSLLDVKTREMIQHRFRQRQAAPVVAAKAPLKISTRQVVMPQQEEKHDDPDLEGFDAFFQTLQDEVHGQHSLVCALYAA